MAAAAEQRGSAGRSLFRDVPLLVEDRPPSERPSEGSEKGSEGSGAGFVAVSLHWDADQVYQHVEVGKYSNEWAPAVFGVVIICFGVVSRCTVMRG